VKYTVTIRGHTFEIEVLGADARVNGEVVRATLHGVPGSPLRVLALPEGVETLAMARRDGGWLVHTGGEVWDARVVDERTRRLQEMTAAGVRPGGNVAVRAPMPGLVLRLEVAVGTAVRAGQGVLVLEAMKMENELTSPIAGLVTALHVRAGEAVGKGAVLVEVSSEG
jgi:pyruvate carboxylase subunit B